ncbi:hypothetical protein D9M70_592860 [compost metagenome]
MKNQIRLFNRPKKINKIKLRYIWVYNMQLSILSHTRPGAIGGRALMNRQVIENNLHQVALKNFCLFSRLRHQPLTTRLLVNLIALVCVRSSLQKPKNIML